MEGAGVPDFAGSAGDAGVSVPVLVAALAVVTSDSVPERSLRTFALLGIGVINLTLRAGHTAITVPGLAQWTGDTLVVALVSADGTGTDALSVGQVGVAVAGLARAAEQEEVVVGDVLILCVLVVEVEGVCSFTPLGVEEYGIVVVAILGDDEAGNAVESDVGDRGKAELGLQGRGGRSEGVSQFEHSAVEVLVEGGALVDYVGQENGEDFCSRGH